MTSGSQNDTAIRRLLDLDEINQVSGGTKAKTKTKAQAVAEANATADAMIAILHKYGLA